MVRGVTTWACPRQVDVEKVRILIFENACAYIKFFGVFFMSYLGYKWKMPHYISIEYYY